MSRPNIVYIHSHDTGRHIQPYGYGVATPRLQRFAEEGVLFRNAYCVSPSCSPSRSALLTGMYPHENGMFGLDHRGGFILNDYRRHMLHTWKAHGYLTVLGGLQHIGADTDAIGFDRVLGNARGAKIAEVVPRVRAFLKEPPSKPFFLDVGFFETHKIGQGGKYAVDYEQLDTRYIRPPAYLPDVEETRTEFAAFAKSVQILDAAVGQVLDGLEESGLADDTLVIVTTDHGLPLPAGKMCLTDAGTEVLLMMRGPYGFCGGKVVHSVVSHLDLFPTICDVLNVPHPPWLRGVSLLPAVRGEADEIRVALFTELTYHTAYLPLRAVRTKRYKYIRNFDMQAPGNNSDPGPSREMWLEHGWPERLDAEEQLYDLIFDPNEACNLAAHPNMAETLEEMRERLHRHMAETGDPLLQGPIPPRKNERLSYVPNVHA